MRADLHHDWQPGPHPRVRFKPCGLCGRAKRNIIHRLRSRCSVCLGFFQHYELDSSRRCDECRP